MHDESLTLLNIMQADLSKHQCSFLSTCDTTVGVFECPDKMIYLAAALQFAGVICPQSNIDVSIELQQCPV